MASRNGPIAAGTDGTDYSHREKVATHYQISVVNKGRLRKCIFGHLILALLMVAKLIPDFLDRLDVFILEIEELEVPQPMKWEYIWLLGTLSSFVGLTAVRKNRIILLQVYFLLINLFSTVPVLFAFMVHFYEFYSFCTEKQPKELRMWQGYPVAALWYAFLVAAAQIHLFTLIFSWKLVVAWKGKSSTSKKNH